MSLLPKRMALGDAFPLTLGSPIRPVQPAPAEQPKVAPSCMTNMLQSDVLGIIKASPTQPEPVEPVSRHNLPAGLYNAKIVSVDVEADGVKMEVAMDPSKVFVSNIANPLEKLDDDFQMRVYGSARGGGKSVFRQHQQQIADLMNQGAAAARLKKHMEDAAHGPFEWFTGANAVAKPNPKHYFIESSPRPEITNRTLQAAIKAKGTNPSATSSKLSMAVEYLQVRFPAAPNLIRAVEQRCCMPPHVTEGLRTAHESGRLENVVREHLYRGDFNAILPTHLQMGGK